MKQAAATHSNGLRQPVRSSQSNGARSAALAGSGLGFELDILQATGSASANRSPASGDVVITEEPGSLEQLYRFAAGGYLFALLDSTDQILVPHKAQSLGAGKAVSLFTGTAREQYWEVAPYLFQVDAGTLAWIMAKLWKEPWGIFLISKAGFEDLRIHLKKFLIVQLPDGKRWFFRYYDPRVLKTYLKVCTFWELQDFFGPIRAYAFTDLDSGNVSILQLPKNPREFGHRPKTLSSAPSVACSIRVEQFAAFEKQAKETFQDRLLQHLKENHAEAIEGLPADVLRARVKVGIRRARLRGFTWESSLAAYVALMFEIAPNFDRHPAIRAILDDSSDPEDRINRLSVDVADEAWEEAERLGNDADWSPRADEAGS